MTFGYEQKAGELSRDLVVGDVLLNLGFRLPLIGGASEYERVYESLCALAREYGHIAKRSLSVNRALQWAVVAASAGGMVSALTSATALVLPFTGVAVSLAGVCACWLSERARKHEKTAASLSNLREEILHSFGPTGRVLRPSEYYSASAK